MQIVDSHTGGEPTRVIVSGGPDLGSGSIAERLRTFRDRFDHIRSGVVNEPRGSDAVVGALLCEPAERNCAAGVIFFNNVGYLNMCGHGTIGLVVTLAHLGRIAAGTHRIETPVGIIEATLEGRNTVAFENVPSYRLAAHTAVEVEQAGRVTGDVAWGGNWFFLVYDCPIAIKLANLEALTSYAWHIRQALIANHITGVNGAEIDHIELYAGPHSRSFVLCPGKSYDRSPCGTGTSAKLACLYSDGKLREGEVWVQQSIIGSVFEGSVSIREGRIVPRIKGSAYITGEATLRFDEHDPFRYGIR